MRIIFDDAKRRLVGSAAGGRGAEALLAMGIAALDASTFNETSELFCRGIRLASNLQHVEAFDSCDVD
jgi:hypothetical protein